MKIRLERINENFLMEATNESKHSMRMDANPEIGGDNMGIRPMETILMGLAGCFSIDILHILKKQKLNPTNYFVEVEGLREKVGKANPFHHIIIQIYMEGEISSEKALRAAELSFQEYCSVSKMLEKSAKIDYQVILNNIKL